MATAAKEVTVRLPRLHTGQLRIRREAEARRARFVVVMCGRRWGKTTDGVEWIADGALDGEPCAWMAPTYKLLGEAWREIVSRLRPVAEVGGHISEQEHRITLPNGGSIECWTLDSPDPARGRKYGRVVIDEAGIVRNLRDIWDAAIRPTLVDLSGHARFYGTPKGRTHGFVQLFAKGEAQEMGWAAFRAPTKENPYIPAAEIEAARADLAPGVFAQEFEGVPADDAANPFGATAISECVAPISTLPAVCWGWDFARAQDWTVGIGLDKTGTVSRFERWQHIPWSDTKARVVQMVGKGRPAIPAVGDSTGVGDAIVEDILHAGIAIEGYQFTPKSKQQLMERLAAAIQGQEVHFPDGVMRAELDTFEYEYTAHGVRYTAPQGLHDDCVMALALALYAYDTYGFAARWQREQIEAGKVDPEPRPNQAMGWDYKNQRQQTRETADDFVTRTVLRGPASPTTGRYRVPR